MSRIIDRGLEEQTVLIVKMGELTYETLAISIHGYIEGKSVQKHVRDLSGILVSMGEKVEDEAFQLIARFQPVATDLRTIKSYMKVSNDFVRYGRYALDICVINDQLSGLKECEDCTRDYINEMSEKVLSMVKISIDALKRYDIELAKTISQTEREVDKMYLDYLDRLIKSKKVNSKCAISSVLMSRYLERIADHAVYVCESIVYICTGKKVALG
jgi:phosphate transport system protein